MPPPEPFLIFTRKFEGLGIRDYRLDAEWKLVLEFSE